MRVFGRCVHEHHRNVEDRCGGNGYAFVLQASNYRSVGLAGSGLAYGGIQNSWAIEFDSFTDRDKNDPGTYIERHISVIAKRGGADNNEASSMAYNDNPLNFKSTKYEGFIDNPEIKIEYLNS